MMLTKPYILDALIENFQNYPDVIEEAKAELARIKSEQAETNSSVEESKTNFNNKQTNLSYMQRISLSKGLLYISALFISTIAFSQEDEEEGDIDTERLIIVKPYSPTVSDV